MSLRRFAVIVLVLGAALVSAFPAAPAMATEAGSEQHVAPSYQELGTSDRAREFLPDPYTAPALFRPMVLPLVAVGLAATVAVLLMYLVWMPRFAEERKAKKKKR